MNENEQKAFVFAYDNTICNIDSDRLTEFVRKYYANEDISQFAGYEYTSIVDALGIWNSAIKYQLAQMVTA